MKCYTLSRPTSHECLAVCTQTSVVSSIREISLNIGFSMTAVRILDAPTTASCSRTTGGSNDARTVLSEITHPGNCPSCILNCCYLLYVICYFWYMLFWYMLFVLPVVCRLLRRCWLPSHKNFAALKKFGVCDNKHFDFDMHHQH